MKAKTPKPEKYVTEKTFDKAMVSIAKTLNSHSKNFELILGELRTIQQDNKHFKDTVSSVQRDSVGYDRQLGNHEIRIEKLEVHA